MADNSQKKSGFGLSDRQSAEATRAVDRAALGIGIVWLLLSAGYFLFFSQDGLDGVRFLLILMVVFMPVAMIWVAAMAMRAARIMEAESARLQAAVDALRKAYVTQSKASSPNEQLPAVSIAKNKASSGDVVLLSPACASFDMFRDFQHRGKKFVETVENLL